MGAENSMLKYYHVEPKHIAEGRCWTFHEVRHKDGNKLSMFMLSCSGTNVSGIQFWKTLRHPYLVKYYASGTDNGKLYVITEAVEPLKMHLSKLSPHEIVCGLHDILEALCFLHEKVKVSCNNVSLSSVFITSDGTWKIGALHCINSFKGETKEFIKSLHTNAESDAIPLDSDTKEEDLLTEKTIYARDAYGFGCLSEKLLKDIYNAPGVTEFQQVVIPQLKSKQSSSRPVLSRVKRDNLFLQNDFLQTKNFLQNFILHEEKDIFKFTQSLIPCLRSWPDKLIASRLVPLFLSRVVLLHPEVNKMVIPYLLIPAKESDEHTMFEGSEIKPLFKETVYVAYIVPLICKILCVWDVHIRLRLLQYFKYYVHLIPKELLKSLILPQLLQGCKDTNDTLVSASLHALADLVPVLGASVVVGGQREKIFSKGFPKVSSKNTEKVSEGVPVTNSHILHPNKNVVSLAKKISLPSDSNKIATSEVKRTISSYTNGEIIENDSQVTSNDEPNSALHPEDLERSSPDGGEELHEQVTDDDQDWPEWDPLDGFESINTVSSQQLASLLPLEEEFDVISTSTELNKNTKHPHAPLSQRSSIHSTERPKKQRTYSDGLGEEYDIMAIEVKPKKNSDFDFFADMEPAIAKLSSMNCKEEPSKPSSSLFAVQTSLTQEIGWDNDDLELEPESSN